MFDLDNPRLRRRLTDGEDIGMFWFALGSAALVEIAVCRGGEAVVLDMQHGLFDRRELEAAVAAVPPSVPCLVRVEDDSAAAIARALDAGAEGILVPMVETGAQAANAASHCRYPPAGGRSGGGVRPLADFAAYRRAADAGITVGMMIETAGGVDNAGAIAAAPNVDFVFIGSGDLSLSLGAAPGDPRFEAAVTAVREACAAVQKPCGIFTMSAQDARRRCQAGFSLTVIANDLSVVRAGFGDASAAFGKKSG